jgi:hypothetical protein
MGNDGARDARIVGAPEATLQAEQNVGAPDFLIGSISPDLRRG